MIVLTSATILARRVLIGLIVALGLLYGSDYLYVRDRKSTRLNSSHLGISYAVFCLKKKNRRCARSLRRSRRAGRRLAALDGIRALSMDASGAHRRRTLYRRERARSHGATDSVNALA